MAERIIELNGIRIPLDAACMSQTMLQVISDGKYEQEEMNLLCQVLEGDDVVMELGTGIGFLATYCAMRIGSERVHTYEPNASLEAYIRRLWELNGVAPTLSICALDSHGGEQKLFVHENFWDSSTVEVVGMQYQRAVSVPAKRFDRELELLKPTFLIIDIEGGEYELLSTTKLEGVRKLLIELHGTVASYDQMVALKRSLWRQGFRLDSRFVTFRRQVRETLMSILGTTGFRTLAAMLTAAGIPVPTEPPNSESVFFARS